MGKASRRKDIVDVIKEQSRKEKRDAGLRRSNATGISSAALSVIGPQHTLGEGAGVRRVGASDLEMHSYNIRDVDKLLFSTNLESSERLLITEHGIEANTFYDSDTNTQTSVGMTFQIPGKDQTGYFGMMYKFKIGGGPQIRIRQDNLNAISLDLNFSDAGKPAIIHFVAPNGVTEANVNDLSIFSDGTDIKAKNSSGTVYTLTSSGGVSLSDNNTWTGTQTFDGDVNTPSSTKIQIDSSSPQNQNWGSQASGFFYIKDSGGTARKVPYR